MTDERNENPMQPSDGFDDDRLLAYALGLDADPELLAAVEDDAELAGRLSAVRACVARIGAQVDAAVPAPDDGYTDLSDERWSGLDEFFEPPATAAPRRERRWWRAVAPIAALVVLALAVGIVAVDRSGQSASSTSTSAGEVARSADDSAAQPAKVQYGASPSAEAVPDTPAQRLVEQLDRFAVVVLARARQASGALQRFAVLRIFKGEAPDVVQLEVDDRPADKGRLHLLMLDPVAATDEQSDSPEPMPLVGTSKGEQGLPGKPLTVAYTYGGEPTMVRELAAGTDPNSVSLPIP